MIGENKYYRVLCEYVQFRHSLHDDFETLILITDDQFYQVPWGNILAHFFRNYIGIIMAKTIRSESEEVRQLTNNQLLCHLIKFAAAWSHFRWRTSFPVVSGEREIAWQVLAKYIRNTLSFYPAQPPLNTYFKFPWQILKYHSSPLADDWQIIFDERSGQATIVYF